MSPEASAEASAEISMAPDPAGPVPASVLSIRASIGVARRHCGESCFAYHASWRITRLTGLKGNPRWHQTFYRQALTTPAARRTAGKAPVRVLICGTADETMLAVLARILGPQRMKAYVLDACWTPLVLCQDYAQAHGIEITTIRDTAPALAALSQPPIITSQPGGPGRAGDVTRGDGAESQFDVIVTDGLLSLLPTPQARADTVARLAGLLAPGGALLYTTRIAGRSGRLEYDRLGRLIQAAICWLAWPGQQRRSSRPAPPPVAQADVGDRAASGSRLALGVLRRPARPAPFHTASDLTAIFAEHLPSVALVRPTGTPSWPVRLAAWLPGRSTSIGVVARQGRRPAENDVPSHAAGLTRPGVDRPVTGRRP